MPTSTNGLHSNKALMRRRAMLANALLVGNARIHGIWRLHSSDLIATSSDVRLRALISPRIAALTPAPTDVRMRCAETRPYVDPAERQLQTCRKLSDSFHRRRTLSAPCRHRADFIVPN